MFYNIDSVGEIVVRYEYDAWGNNAVLNADGTDCVSGIGVLNPFRYRSYYYDAVIIKKVQWGGVLPKTFLEQQFYFLFGF